MYNNLIPNPAVKQCLKNRVLNYGMMNSTLPTNKSLSNTYTVTLCSNTKFYVRWYLIYRACKHTFRQHGRLPYYNLKGLKVASWYGVDDPCTAHYFATRGASQSLSISLATTSIDATLGFWITLVLILNTVDNEDKGAVVVQLLLISWHRLPLQDSSTSRNHKVLQVAPVGLGVISMEVELNSGK